MKFFKRSELVAVLVIIFIVLLVSLSNFRIALRRARDVQRKNDIRLISNLVEEYHADYGFFPPSNEKGQIKGCFTNETFRDFIQKEGSSDLSDQEKFDMQEFFDEVLTACDWGVDPLPEPNIMNPVNYIQNLPRDPQADEGLRYFYISNGSLYQAYAYLEGESEEAEYDGTIVERGLDCGGVKCNFGLAHGKTPLDKSIEEYQNELIRKRQQ